MYSDCTFSDVPKFQARRAQSHVADFLLQIMRYGLTVKESQADLILDLVAQANLITRLGMCMCNGIRQSDGFAGLSDDQQTRIESSGDIAEEHARKSILYLFPMAEKIEFSYDPRGCPIRFTIPNVGEILVDGGE